MANELTQRKRRSKKAKAPQEKPLTEAEKEQIQANFKKIAKLVHPDLIGEAGNEIMKILGEAKEKLMTLSSQFPPHIGIILDNSGSMQPIKDEVIRSFNHFLCFQKQCEADASFCLTTFSKSGKIIPLEDAQQIDESSYVCNTGTPLHDTIARVIHRTEDEGKANVVIVIFTDGQECHSHAYRDPAKIRALVEKKLDDGWQFILCTSDSRLTGTNIGIKPECVTNFTDFTQMIEMIGAKLIQYRKGEVKQITFEE